MLINDLAFVLNKTVICFGTERLLPGNITRHTMQMHGCKRNERDAGDGYPFYQCTDGHIPLL